MPFYDDLDIFLEDFGIDLTYNGAPIRGIYTPSGTPVENKFLSYVAAQDELIVKSTDCPSIKKTDTFIINSSIYYPYKPIPDGTGFTKMYLASEVQ